MKKLLKEITVTFGLITGAFLYIQWPVAIDMGDSFKQTVISVVTKEDTNTSLKN
ncbi:hypothetical protein M4L90_12255 [Staphylococcus equorum]|uniref:Uncharacterized protein n=1 Tax=Staphylococcus equorum TaxID=246432 RepID=A0A9X4R1C0_9STAP|nr:hypothetical protein [Staphylococcus equorum]MDG0820692.1 hypothetical protein [Staphylococcus equorum]MDG0841317.1 hypothetical protein [Staphylococcus equorum]MDG0847017.1 hypothetical protein [Staphylococcus equorum]